MTPPIKSERLDIEGCRRERGPEWCAIFDTMRDYRLSNMVFDGTEEPYCLVDAVSNEGGSVGSGEEQLLMLADEISLALAARRAANTPVDDACATEGCENIATQYFEAGGVGSHYCGDCFHKIASRSGSPALPSQVVDEGDLASDERWNEGVNYAIKQLCELLGIDWRTINWDAATETLDGDVRSVIGNVLVAAYGEEWSGNERDTAIIKAALSSLHPTEGDEPGAPFLWLSKHDASEMLSGMTSNRHITGWRQPTDKQGNELVPLYTRSSPVSAEVTVTDEMVERARYAHADAMDAGRDYVEAMRAALLADLPEREG